MRPCILNLVAHASTCRLLLLTIPLPRVIAKGVVRFVDMLSRIELAGIPVVSVITFLAFVSLAGTFMRSQRPSGQVR
jgi:hypothetical protein